MNSLYRRLYSRFWSDSKITKMTNEERYVFLYLMTSPYSNLPACYELPIDLASKEVGLHNDELIKIIHELRDVWKVIDFDDATSEVLICNRCKHEWNPSDRTMAGVKNQSRDIKNSRMKNYIDFLISNGYSEKNWNNSICNYYTGSWREGESE